MELLQVSAKIYSELFRCYVPIQCPSNNIHCLPPCFSVTTTSATHESKRVSSTKYMRFNFWCQVNVRVITCCHTQIMPGANFFPQLIILKFQHQLFTKSKHNRLHNYSLCLCDATLVQVLAMGLCLCVFVCHMPALCQRWLNTG